MWVSSDDLLAVLPPFNDKSVLIEPSQDVPDIIREVVQAHKYFASDYDAIWQFFYRDTIGETCRDLFDFCKKNIRYVIETEEEQTTKSPSAILAIGSGDCKHYAAFIAGVLAAIVRNTGEKIDCYYRFGSYDIFDTQPGHVFVVVKENGKEIWVDPVLSSFNERLQPYYIVDKKIKAMPLYRVSGIDWSSLEDIPGVDDTNISETLKYVQAGQEFTSDLMQGEINVEAAVELAQQAGSFIKSFGDQVPDYPVASLNTLNAIKQQIAVKIPLPPKNIDDAYRLLAIAEKERDAAFNKTSGTKRVNDTYGMVYEEYAAALRNYIASKTQSGGGTPTSLTAGAQEGTGVSKTNLLLIGGAVLVGGLVLFGKKRKKVSGKQSLLIPAAIAVVGYFLFIKKNGVTSVVDIRRKLISWYNSTTDSVLNKSDFSSVVNRMTDSEVAATGAYIFNYVTKDVALPVGSALYDQISAISAKYNIFT